MPIRTIGIYAYLEDTAMKLICRSLTAGILLTCLLDPPALPGQTVQRDPVTRDYRVTYTGLDGNEYTVLVNARDKVAPAVHLTIERADNVLAYRYTLENRDTPMAEQPIVSFDLACPDEADPVLSMRRPPSWRVFKVAKPGRLGCSFRPAEAPLSRGEEVTGLEVLSSWLPGMSVARVQGLTDFAGFESGEDTPREVAQLVRELRLPTDSGNWQGVRTVAPSRPPTLLSDPAAGIALVSEDLDATCELGWIDREATCLSLRVKLDESAAAVARSEPAAARDQLSSFLVEIEDQHGPEAGKHINDNAYWLLKTNAELVLSSL